MGSPARFCFLRAADPNRERETRGGRAKSRLAQGDGGFGGLGGFGGSRPGGDSGFGGLGPRPGAGGGGLPGPQRPEGSSALWHLPGGPTESRASFRLSRMPCP